MSPAISELNAPSDGAYSMPGVMPGLGTSAMNKSVGPRNEMITPDDFEKIEDAFREMVRERQLALDSEEADVLAARLISLFQSGIHHHEALKQMAEHL